MDTIVATRSAQRIDMVSLIPQAEIAGPSAVTRVKEIANDVRLPSRAALEQRLGLELSGGSNGKLELRLAGSKNVTLSALARAVSAILVPHTGSDLKIRSPEPLWLHSRPPVAAQLTTKLAQTVVFSGLFYESHLQQFAAGLRSLELMVREPQAGLVLASLPLALKDLAPAASPAAGVDALVADTAPGVTRHADKVALAAVLSEASATAGTSGPVPTVYGQDGRPVKSALLPREAAGVVQPARTTVSTSASDLRISMVTAQAGLAPASLPVALTDAALGVPAAAGVDMFDADAMPGVDHQAASAKPAAPAAPAAPASAVPETNTRAMSGDPVPFSTVYGQDGKPGKLSPLLYETAGDMQTAKTTMTEPLGDLRSSSAVTAVIHPDAMGLVRQQLELLAVPVFRWCGEAWPGAPLEWDVQKEQPEDAGTSDGQSSQPAWSTNLTLSLPVLKSVQASLNLVGNVLQVRLICDEDATLTVLNESRHTLVQRFGPLGLQLATLHMGKAGAAGGIDPPKR